MNSSIPLIAAQPAAVAWRRFSGAAAEPRSIACLKPETKRSAVYRLDGIGAGGSAIIAKRGRSDRVATEVLVYREALALFPGVALQCHGWINDEQPGFSWLFLEDAGDERFSSDNAQHRALAGHWLALLHVSIPSQSVLQSSLPKRDLAYYRGILALAREIVEQSLPNPALSSSDGATLQTILLWCDRLQERWSSVELTCQVLPETLVHGDFGAKNVRVRSDSGGPRFLPLDWDSAGWGIAASDLSHVDIAAYGQTASIHWPKSQPRSVDRVATIGRAFFALESLTGERDSLGGDWPERAMRKTRAYESALRATLEHEGWRSP